MAGNNSIQGDSDILSSEPRASRIWDPTGHLIATTMHSSNMLVLLFIIVVANISTTYYSFPRDTIYDVR